MIERDLAVTELASFKSLFRFDRHLAGWCVPGNHLDLAARVPANTRT